MPVLSPPLRGKKTIHNSDMPSTEAARRNRRRARWEALTICALLLGVSVAATFGLWRVSSIHDDQAFQRYVITLAEVAASRVDPHLHEALTRPDQFNGPDYLRAVAPLQTLKRSLPDIHYLYTLVWDGHDLRYVLDANKPGTIVNGLPDQQPLGQAFEADAKPLLPALGIGAAHPVPIITPIVTDGWGSFVVAFAPIYGSANRPIAMVGVAVDASIYLAQLRHLRNSALLGLLPAAALILLLGVACYVVRLRGLTLETMLAEAAQTDKLTGLFNRRVFMEKLDRSLEALRDGTESRAAIIFADFDKFKLINDTRGHEAGDELLRQIADRLRQHASAEVNVSRFGGDEFLVLCHGATAYDMAAFCTAVLGTLSQPYDLNGAKVHSTASIGWVLCDGALSAEVLLRDADLAMYEAKNRGGACWVEFDSTMRERRARNRLLESGLRAAVGTDQLHVVYQPVLNLRSNEIACVEASLRWQHPAMGAVPPSEFIPVAEEAGLAGTLGSWLLEESCQMLAKWRQREPKGAPEWITVSIGRAQLAQAPDLAEQVRKALTAAALPPECLQLAIGEQDAARLASSAPDLLKQLRMLGVRLMLDNFGSTTSALALLRDHPFDTVKIDRTLLARLDVDDENNAVVKAALQLVENLGMASVATGVETLTQLAMLETLGCGFAQGHFVGMALPTGRLLAVENLSATGSIHVPKQDLTALRRQA